MSDQGPSSVEPFSVEPAVALEIEAYAREALARFGAPGRPYVEGRDLVLAAPQGLHRTALGLLPTHWTSLSDEARRKRMSDVVRRLLGQRRSVAVQPERSPAAKWGVVALFIGAAAAGVAYRLSSQPPEPDVVRRPAASVAALTSEEERAARAARVCESTRGLVLRGGTVGPADLEGWVVDVLVLARGATEPLEGHPALATYLKEPTKAEGTSFIWSEEPELTRLTDSETRVVVRRELIEGSAAERTPGVRLTFEGRLTEPYFDPERRRSYFHVVSSLTDALGGTHAGLFARCANSATHHVGSWFRGPTPGEAAASLVYLLGTYAEPPHVAESFLRPPTTNSIDRSLAFANIRVAHEKLDQRAVATAAGHAGGMISGPPSGPFVITFPFTDGNRGSRTSRGLAREVGMGRE